MRQPLLQMLSLVPLVALVTLLAPAACSSRSSLEGASSASASSLAAAAAPDLTWIGDTQITYELPNLVTTAPPNDIPVAPSFVVAANALTILTQAYPQRSAASLTLFWANADYSSVSSAPMTLASEGAGTFGDNDEFRGTIPASALVAGLATHYWVRGDGVNGQTLYDSQNGANYTVVPRAVSVGWAGDLGSYDAQGGFSFYRVGNLFNADLSTSTGCFWEGADDYGVQAFQVYAPGLTDQGYTGNDALVASSLVVAEVWTDLRADGWGAVPTTCRAGIGNNFVCQLPIATFPNGGGCLVDGPVPPGDYEYKVRVSVDGGTTWYWVGSSDGAGGGANLRVQYDPGCLYSGNDPFTCIGSPLFEAGGVVRLAANVGASASSAAVLTNTSTPLTLDNIRLVGTDASKFALHVARSTGASVTASTVSVAAGETLDFTVTYSPSASNAGSLPDMADVAWDAPSADGGVGPTTYALHVRGVAN